MADFTQITTPGGHVLTMATEVSDGHLEVEATFTSIYVRGELPGERVLVGSTCTERRAWINGSLVLDPEYSQRLWEEALRG